MAFLKKKKRLSFTILAGILFIIIVSVVSGGAYYFHIMQINSVRESYSAQILELKYDINSLERKVYVPKDDIPCGTVLSEELFSKEQMKLDISQDSLIDESDFGKVNIAALQAGIPVFKFMTADSDINDDVRSLNLICL